MKEEAVKKSNTEKPASDEIHYDIGAVSNSSFMTSVYDYNIDLCHLSLVYEAIFWHMITVFLEAYLNVRFSTTVTLWPMSLYWAPNTAEECQTQKYTKHYKFTHRVEIISPPP